jgi:hypothetical protein
MTRSHPKVNYTKKPSLNQCQLRYFKKQRINLSSTIFENTKQFTMDNQRCGWCLSSDLYKEYHDQEWELLFMMMPLCLNSLF